MNITNFHEKVYEVNNDIPYLVHQLFSAVDLLRIVVEKSEDEGLLESCPLAGLRGVLNLLDHVGDQFGKLEIRSEEVPSTLTRTAWPPALFRRLTAAHVCQVALR